MAAEKSRKINYSRAWAEARELIWEHRRSLSIGLALMLVSGFLIFTGGALTYFEGQWFRRKMTLLLIAVVFNFSWFRIVTNAPDGRFGPWTQRLTAGLALLLWFGVGVSGRAIAFF